jgi:hypothetical protein
VEAPVETVKRDQGMSSRGLVGDVISDAQRLVALEIALARQEAKELAMRNAIAVGLILCGGLLAMVGILVAVPSLVISLVPWKWEAAAIWVAAYVLIGVVLVLLGRSRLQLRVPPRTVASLKENKAWALRRVRSNGR